MPTHDAGDLETVLKDAAELFGLLSAPMRLHIISALCQAVCTQVAIGLDVNDQTNKEFV